MRNITINLDEWFGEELVDSLSNTTLEYIKEITLVLLTKDDEWIERFYIKLKKNKVRV